jgi:CBS domain containing-hemolysin-like protein
MVWSLVALGLGLMIAGTLVTAGAAGVRRVELYRWVSLGRSGAGAAGTLLQAPGRLFRSTNALGTLGAIVVGCGLMSAATPLGTAAGLATIALVGVPLVLAIGHAVPRVLGRAWAPAIVTWAIPWFSRAAPVLAPLGPPGPAGGDELDGGEELTVLSGVVTFTERLVREVMTPRTEIVAVREGAPVEEIARVFAESGYSRLPVYRDSLDNIVGMVYAFDLLKIAPGAELPLRPVVSTPASKRCSALLEEMRRDRRQFAVALDEYGGTAGIVTFEDLLEELVGEIFDEYDRRVMEDASLVDIVEATGTTPVEEIRVRFEVPLPSGVETIGGLLARAAGQIPRVGDRYLLHGLEFDVLAATPNRVERVMIRRGPVPTRELT